MTLIDPSRSASDLFLSATLSASDAASYLASRGFHDPVAADERLQRMAEELVVRESLGAMAEPLVAGLAGSPDPDRALGGLERYFATCTSKPTFLRHLREDGRALAVLSQLFGASPLLTDTLVRNPEYFHWLLPQLDRHAQTPEDRERYVHALLVTLDGLAPSLDVLRRLKRREVLRIAARELLGRDSAGSAMEQLSDLADLLIRRSLSLVCQDVCEAAGWSRLPGSLAVVATGRLGARELDYVSAVDLFYVYEPADATEAEVDELFQDIARRLTIALVDDSGESELYRINVPARAGEPARLAVSLSEWESGVGRSGTSGRFALQKSRPISGDQALCTRFMARADRHVYAEPLDRDAAGEMLRLQPGREALKTMELFTQTLQMMHGIDRPGLRSSNTLSAAGALAAGGFITREAHEALSASVTFLRTVDHRVQLAQESDLAGADESGLACCARQLGFRSVDALQAEIDTHRSRIDALCRIEP